MIFIDVIPIRNRVNFLYIIYQNRTRSDKKVSRNALGTVCQKLTVDFSLKDALTTNYYFDNGGSLIAIH
jgi:hypothetical protein